MSIRRRARGAYQVRLLPFPAKTFPTLEAARAYDVDLKLRKSLGDLYQETPNTVAEELDGFLSRKRATANLSVRTLEFNERCAKFWRERFGRLPLASLRRSPVEDAIAARAAVHPRSAKNELEFLKAVLQQAEERGQRFDRTLYGIPPVRHEERVGVALTLEQVAELASWVPEYVRRIVPVAATLAARSSELFTLTEDRVDLAARTVTIPRVLNKSRRLKVIDLTAGETKLLREQLLARPAGTPLVFPKRRGGQWNRHHFRDRVWVKAAVAAGLGELVEQPDGTRSYEGLHFHDLRHTATSLMCTAGLRPELVAERRGDADGGVLVLRRYRHLYPSEMKSAVVALDAFVAADRGPVVDEEWTSEERPL